MATELAQLQAQLQSTFAAPSAVRITQSNAVELVQRLKELQLVDVLFTRDGSAFVTPQHLEDEVADEVALAGRVRIAEVADTLLVEYVEVEAAVRRRLARNPTALVLVGDEILHPPYLEELMSEVLDEAIAHGVLPLATAVVRVALPSSFLRQQLEALVSRDSRLVLLDAALYSQVFLDRIMARVRGRLRAALLPTRLNVVLAASGAEGHAERIEALVAREAGSGKLDGTLAGSGVAATWVPDVYTQARVDAVERQLEVNSVVLYSVLAECGFDGGAAFAHARWGESGVALESVFVASSHLDVVDAIAGAALAPDGPGFVSLRSALHPDIGPDDTALVLERGLLPCLGGDVQVLDERGAAVAIAGRLMEVLRAAVSDAVETALEAGAYESVFLALVQLEEGKAGARSKRGRSDHASAAAKGLVAELTLPVDAVEAAVSTASPELGREAECLDAVTAALVGESKAMIAGALRSALERRSVLRAAAPEFSGGSSEPSPEQAMVSEVAGELEVYAAGVRYVAELASGASTSPGVAHALEAHVLKTVALPLVDALVASALAATGSELPQPVTASKRKKAIKTLTEPPRDTLLALVKAGTPGKAAKSPEAQAALEAHPAGERIDKFLAALMAAAPVLDLALEAGSCAEPSAQDGRRQAHMAVVADALGAATDPADALQLVLVYLFASDHHALVNVAGRDVGRMVSLYTSVADSAEQLARAELLTSLYDVTYEWLIGRRADAALGARAVELVRDMGLLLGVTAER
ncbi:uncharacterized protein AMSG_04610 [Thecamonas trahens ATCC 50062]|uniref:E3 UFM1-protein ligase 1-like N-terminal domain-containing protein n=1 Tax=Thecamonas trahens ATCC 50062 TaxID=461836 RepID=A0A0L0D9E7_THETB|nr:hypothetical protein AMSG_04610 [Thecamonas trahens ATCC 50062]KNC48865.1 hypothetical protein AMSG_04610 [Thecamonas trahens ATCC 50062]|eukprot:XP_013758285.1 hypothetical protein AMSG_04610 [Thecamonas trahens ATCC 50062]